MENQNQLFWKDLVKRSAVLSPTDRISEVLFGLIMVLSFTGVISASSARNSEVRELLWAALGCNLAWGLVDAIMYLMNVIVERGYGSKILMKMINSDSNEQSVQILRNQLQPLISRLLTDDELIKLSEKIKKVPPLTKKNLVSFSDLVACGQIFLLVFLCTLPVALPFLFITDVAFALRTSNAIAIFLLFIGGFVLAKYAGFRPFPTAIVYTLIGLALVFLTILLGG